MRVSGKFSIGGLAAMMLALGAGASTASAALLSGSVSTSPPQPENLTTDGTLDWAIWDYTTSPIGGGAGSSTAAPSNRKLTVTPLISDVTTLVGVARGTTATGPTQTYTYIDGNGPTAQTNTVLGEVFDSSLNNANAGVTLTITSGPANVPERVRLFVSGFAATPVLTATLPGTPPASFTDNSVTYTNLRSPTMYTLDFTPDTTGAPLTITYKTGPGSTSNGNVDLQAVTVGVPEPASLGLLGTLLGGLLLRRRRVIA